MNWDIQLYENIPVPTHCDAFDLEKMKLNFFIPWPIYAIYGPQITQSTGQIKDWGWDYS